MDLAQQLTEQIKQIAAVWTKLDPDTSKTDINRRVAKTLIQIIISALHDAMTSNSLPKKAHVNFDQPEQVKNIAERLDPALAARKIADCCKAARWLEANTNEKLIFDHLLLNLANSDKMTA